MQIKSSMQSNTHTQTHTHTCSHQGKRSHRHVCAATYIPQVQGHTHIYISSYICTCTHTHAQACRHTHTPRLHAQYTPAHTRTVIQSHARMRTLGRTFQAFAPYSASQHVAAGTQTQPIGSPADITEPISERGLPGRSPGKPRQVEAPLNWLCECLLCLCVRIRVYLSECLFMHPCADCVCMFVYASVCNCVCVYVCLCIRVRLCVCVHAMHRASCWPGPNRPK